MEQFIGCDAHKKYSVFVAMDERGKFGPAETVIHDRKVYREFLARLPDHSPIAVEATGSCYWLVDEMREAGHEPQLAHPLESKRRMGKTKKTDRLDARALAMLLRNGTLPRVWIPPAELRDQREPMRMRSLHPSDHRFVWSVSRRSRPCKPQRHKCAGTWSAGRLAGAAWRVPALPMYRRNLHFERFQDLRACATSNGGY